MLPGPGEDPVILAGDFNATLDHAPMRAVLRRGYRDAAEQVGKGLVPTWGPRAGRRPGLLVIDHVLVDPRCTVQAVAAYNLPGTDHRVLLAEVRLPG
jgi:endonuclease/exonuclease/phosphatase family metal-dependent hydrolase